MDKELGLYTMGVGLLVLGIMVEDGTELKKTKKETSQESG